MNTTEKYITDQEFKEKGMIYVFTLYPTIRDAENEWNGTEAMVWLNNNLTRHEAQLLLMGIVSGARYKYKHPKAVLYAFDRHINKTILSSCI